MRALPPAALPSESDVSEEPAHPAPARAPWLVLRAARKGGPSLRINRRAPPALLLLSLLVALLLLLTLALGEYRIAPLDVLRTLLGFETADPNHALIVNQIRLPRALVALMAGAMLALSGAIMQTLTRNPLASPEITGVSAGASLAAVTLIAFLPGVSHEWLPVAALGGGLATAALVYLLTWQGGDSPLRLILVGIGLASVLGATQSVMLLSAPIEQVQSVLHWLTGSVYARTWTHFYALLPWFLVLAPATLLLAQGLDLLHLGDELARGLGMQVNRQRGLMLVAAVGLAAAAVSQVGAIAFIGLVAPHVARRFGGHGHSGLLLLSALMGGALLLAADLIGRVFFAPSEAPAGIFTALIGAPFFVYLLWRHHAEH